MSSKATILLATAGAILLSSTAIGLAAKKDTKCSSIMAICQQRAEGQVAICDDMYRSALSNGYWQATQEPDGTKHPQIACSR